jgi:uncharacterized protein YdeI (YjbR/CyaY-like superfamily)
VPADEVHVSDRAEVHRWLGTHGDRRAGVWFVYAKGKGRTLDYEEVVEEALCFGWVDSRSRSYDDTRTMLYLAPRKAASPWSASNVARVGRLTTAGLMQRAGIQAVEAAKADGRWPAAER